MFTQTQTITVEVDPQAGTLSIDDNLVWDHHINFIASKIFRGIGALYRLKKLVPISLLLPVYHALVHCHLTYGITVWGCSYKKHINKLQVLQNKAIRIISNIPARSTVNPEFRKLGILKVSDLYEFEIVKIMKQYNERTLPEYFDNFFQCPNSIHHYNTRFSQNQSLFVKLNSSRLSRNSLSYIGVKFWNNVPTLYRTLPYHTFKARYCKFILSKY